MKSKYRFSFALAVIGLWSISSLRADVIFYGLQNVVIPANFDGVYVNLQTGVTSSAGNWDINPFLGGSAVANSPNFQPARVGINNEDRIVNLGFGTTISGGAQNYSTGFGGSQTHIGPAANQFQANTPGYIGYRYTPGGTTFNGWMRAILNPNTAGGVLMDWAYETTPGQSIAAGNILQAAPVSGVSLVTLTAATGESPVLGTNLVDVGMGNITAVVKNGAGTWTLGNQSYTGTTTVNAGTLAVGANGGKVAGTSGIVVNNGGTLLLTNNTTSDRINDNASVTMAAGSTFNTGGLSESTSPPAPVLESNLGGKKPLSRTARRYFTRYSYRPLAGNKLYRGLRMPGDEELPDEAWSAQLEDEMQNRPVPGNNMPGYRPSGSIGSGLGALTLQGTAASSVTFDFGTLGGSTLIFNMLDPIGKGSYVNILNWSGSGAMDNGAISNDRLLFLSNLGFTLADLANFNFDGYGPGAMQINYNGYYELVPVPEPTTWAAGILALLGAGWSQRRRLRKTS